MTAAGKGKGKGPGLFFRIAAAGLLILATAVALGVIIPAWVVTDRLMNPPLRPVKGDPGREGLSWQTVRFRSMDGHTSSGWLIPCRRTRPLWLILMPPFRSGPALWPDDEGLTLLRRFSEHRWSVLVLAPDRFPDSRDVIGAARYLKTLDPEAEIGAVGWGEGASAALCATAGTEDILFCVADSPYADLKQYLAVRLPVWSGLPRNPWTPASLTLFALRSGIDYRTFSPFEAVRTLEKPILILVADGNPQIANAEGVLLADTARRSRLSQLPLADHTRGYAEYPETWMLEVTGFLQGLGYY